MAEELFALFLDPHGRPFHLAHHEVVGFVDWFVEQASGLINRLIVHPDEQTADKLVMIE